MPSSVFVGARGVTSTFSAVTIEVAPGAAVAADPDAPPSLLIAGDTSQSAFVEIHNNYAVGIDLYSHASQGFRAPYINFYKSRGTQAAPTSPTLTGYELDSVGGINFGGYTGHATTPYQIGAAIYSQVDEDWSDGHHGAHLSIYASSIGGTNVNQIIQFAGLDPQDASAHNTNGVSSNIISYRPISFNGNSANNPMLKPSSSPPTLRARNATDTADAALTCGALTTSGGLFSYGANDSAGAGFRLVRVPNA